MNKYRQPNGVRCVVCGRVFQPRVMRDGSLSQTCGQTACVVTHNRRKDNNHTYNNNRPRNPNTKKNPSLI